MLLVDGIQKVYQQNPLLMTQFIDSMTGQVNNTGSAFVIEASAGTFYDPIETCLRGLF